MSDEESHEAGITGPPPLLEAWRRAGTTGPGVDILENRDVYTAFLM